MCLFPGRSNLCAFILVDLACEPFSWEIKLVKLFPGRSNLWVFFLGDQSCETFSWEINLVSLFPGRSNLWVFFLGDQSCESLPVGSDLCVFFLETRLVCRFLGDQTCESNLWVFSWEIKLVSLLLGDQSCESFLGRSRRTLRASLSGTFLQTLPDLVTPLKGHSLSPRSCLATRSAPSERFGY